MTKRILAIILAVIFVLPCLFACNSGESKDTSTEAPETEAPVTDPVTEPVTTPTETALPGNTEPPMTEAPETEAPETEAPATEAPATEAPETEAPETEAPETEAPETEAPETEAPETEAPETEAPEAGDTLGALAASYVPVYAQWSSQTVLDAMEQLRIAIGSEQTAVEDTVAAAEYELLLGGTNRPTSGAALYHLWNAEDYHPWDFVISVTEKEIAIVGGSDVGIEKGVAYFIEHMLNATTTDYPAGEMVIVRAAPAKKGEAPAELSGMKLVWNDEFDNDFLDKNKWSFYQHHWLCSDIEPTNTSPCVDIVDGQLVLSAYQKNRNTWQVSETLSTEHSMSYQYGYLEMYAQVPYMKGAWPSLWLKSDSPYQTTPYFVEVDVFEVFGEYNSLQPNLHKWNKNVNPIVDAQHPDWQPYYFYNYENLNNEFHYYGFGWTPTEMYFTVDGNIYARYDITKDYARDYSKDSKISGMDGFHDPLYIALNLGLFTPATVDEWTSWAAHKMIDQNATYPITYKIEWIRLYQTPGVGQIFEN